MMDSVFGERHCSATNMTAVRGRSRSDSRPGLVSILRCEDENSSLRGNFVASLEIALTSG